MRLYKELAIERLRKEVGGHHELVLVVLRGHPRVYQREAWLMVVLLLRLLLLLLLLLLVSQVQLLIDRRRTVGPQACRVGQLGRRLIGLRNETSLWAERCWCVGLCERLWLRL